MGRGKRHRAAAHLIHAFDSPARIAAQGPRTLVRGKGARVWDAQGNEYLDGLSSLWNVSIGHGRGDVARAVAQQIFELGYAPTLLGFSSEPAQELARRIASWAPGTLNHVLFTSGGSESNESVIRLARLYWKLRGHRHKTRFITLNGAYHGSTTGAATLTGLDKFHQHYGPLMPGITRIARPHCEGCELGLRYPECEIDCATLLQRTIDKVGAERIAAFIAEPIQGVGGVIVPPKGYHERVREICDANDILMVSDEVITGFGRTGKKFGIQHWKATPDMLVFAKGVSSGYVPLGGVILSKEIYGEFTRAGEEFSLSHGFTYSGHPVACAAGLATLDILEKENLVRRAAVLGRRLAKQLREIERHDIVREVRSIGMMAAIEIADSNRGEAAAVRDLALERGIIVRASGNNVVLCPPLVIEEKDLDRIVETIDDAITALSS